MTDRTAAVPVLQPIFTDRLVKVDLPELTLDPSSPRQLEIYMEETDSWRAWSVERVAIDGRVLLRDVLLPAECEWLDLSTVKYRWLA